MSQHDAITPEPSELPEPMRRLLTGLKAHARTFGTEHPTELLRKLEELVTGSFGLEPELEACGVVALDGLPDDAKPLLLSAWLTEEPLDHATVLTQRDNLASLGRALDAKARSDLGAFVPAHWGLLEGGGIVVDQGSTQRFRFPRGLARVSQAQRAARLVLHPRLLQNPTQVHPETAMRFSLAIFLTGALSGLGQVDATLAMDALPFLRDMAPQLPPELPTVLAEALDQRDPQKPKGSCSELMEELIRALERCSEDGRPPHDPQLRHSADQYSVPGLSKQGGNEDRVAVYSGAAPTSFLAVADGVSTADIGSGRRAADWMDRVVDIRAASVADLPTDDGWEPAARAWLSELFEQVHTKIVADADDLLAEAPLGERHSMSTTLVAALVLGNRAVVASVGDSPAWRYEARTGRLFPLLQPHTVAHDQARRLRDVPGDTSEGQSALTCTLGQCRWDGAIEKLDATPLELRFHVETFEPGDMLVLSSDGLVDCIKGVGPFDRASRLAAILTEADPDSTSPRRIARQLVSLGEDENSTDNITAALLRFEAPAAPDCPKPQRAASQKRNRGKQQAKRKQP